MTEPKRVYLGLGSNLGNRQDNLEEAVRRLEQEGVRPLRYSSIWETEPREVLDQPWFLNMAVEAETRLFPRQLLACIQRIELAMGRRRVIAKGPRLIDIDILFYGPTVVATADLLIPHPAIAERRFVLEPLAELSPEFRHPVSGITVADMLRLLGTNQLCRLLVKYRRSATDPS